MIEEHDFSKFMLIFVSIFMGFSIKNKPSVLALLSTRRDIGEYSDFISWRINIW